MTKSNAIAIAILAGGEGSRIGGNKPFVRLGTSSLLERSWNFASTLSDKVTLVLRTRHLAGASDYPVVTDRPDIEGPLAGLASALAWAKSDGREAVVTVPCDMPFLPSDLVERLTSEIGGMAAAIAASDGRMHPVCGLWKVSVSEELKTYSEGGGRSLQGLARAVGFAQIEWAVQEVDPFFNINSQDDLAEARGYLATRN